MKYIYQIQVRGQLTDDWSDWFAGLRINRFDLNQAFGLADGPKQQAATPETIDHWWLMTKIVTALAVLQLQEQGRLKLDDPVTDYLPAFQVKAVAAGDPPVTIRHLLNLLLAYLNGGELDGVRILSAQSVALMTSSSHVIGEGPNMAVYEHGQHGLGWYVIPEGERVRLQHHGAGPGFATTMRLYPQEGLGIAILANGADLDRDGIAARLAQIDWSIIWGKPSQCLRLKQHR
jgi:CubicO group peptidase (beta-lactamase class C family)